MSGLWDTNNMQPNHDIVVQGETIPAIFWNAVEKRGPGIWMRQKHLGLWRSWTWNQTADAVREIAAGLVSLGFNPGDCASVLANTVVEWVWADLAILSCAGISNGVYPTDAASQLQYLCEDSRTSILFVEDDEQLDKALEVRSQLPGLQALDQVPGRVQQQSEQVDGIDARQAIALEAPEQSVDYAIGEPLAVAVGEDETAEHEEERHPVLAADDAAHQPRGQRPQQVAVVQHQHREGRHEAQTR